MDFSLWDTLLNILILLFWYKAVSVDDREAFFNPYLAPASRLTAAAIDFLRPVFFGLPPRLIACTSAGFLILLRGLAAPTSQGHWLVAFGFFRWGLSPNPTLLSCIAFSLVSFCAFLFNLWGIALIYAYGSTRLDPGRARATLRAFARPFTAVPWEYSPLVLFAFGVIVVHLLNVLGMPVRPIIEGIGPPPQLPPSSPSLILGYGILACTAWTNILGMLVGLIFVLIIGSWISMFARSPGIMMFCREWLELLIGPARRFPLRIGMLDLTPLIFIFVLRILQGVLMGILSTSFLKLL